MVGPSPMVQAVRPREGPWWRAQRALVGRWITEAARAAPAGVALKTDLFDEASGPHHPAADVTARFALVGMDLDSGVVVSARARLTVEGRTPALVVCDVRALPFAEESVALVLSLSTLDHLSSEGEIVQALTELHRVLRRGGRLLLTLDNPVNPEVALRAALPASLVSRLRADTFPLGVTLGARRGGRILQRVGFRVEQQGYLGHAMRYPSIRLLRWLDRRDRAGWAERLVLALEGMSRWPSRFLTGHFVVWICTKPWRCPGDVCRAPSG